MNHLTVTPGPPGCPIGYPRGTPGVSCGKSKALSNQKLTNRNFYGYFSDEEITSDWGLLLPQGTPWVPRGYPIGHPGGPRVTVR